MAAASAAGRACRMQVELAVCNGVWICSSVICGRSSQMAVFRLQIIKLPDVPPYLEADRSLICRKLRRNSKSVFKDSRGGGCNSEGRWTFSLTIEALLMSKSLKASKRAL